MSEQFVSIGQALKAIPASESQAPQPQAPQPQAPQPQAPQAPKASAPKTGPAKAPKAPKAPKGIGKGPSPKALKAMQQVKDLALQAKIEKALQGLTPEMAAAELASEKANGSAGALKAWATRRANGFDATKAAQQSWITRRAIKAAKAALASKAKAPKAPKAPKLVKKVS